MPNIVKLRAKGDVPGLIKALGHRNRTVREDAARALEEIGTAAVEPLVATAVEPFMAGFRQSDPAQRGAAATALGDLGNTEDAQFGESLETALRADFRQMPSWRWQSLGAMRTLWQIGPGAVEPLVATALELLITALGDEHEHVRDSAARALWTGMGIAAIEPLIIALRDENPSVRVGATNALGHIGDSRAVKPLATALRDDHESVRDSAARALGHIGDGEALEPLVFALGDEHSSVRLSATEALAGIGDTRAVESLVSAVGDEDPGVRRAAAQALKEVGDARAVEPLVAALGDEDWAVRKAAASALGRIGAAAFEPLVIALRHDDSAIRAGAAEALGTLKDPRVPEPLAAALGDESESVRWAVVEALGQIGSGDVIEPLAEALEDKSELVRVHAAAALAMISDERAYESTPPRAALRALRARLEHLHRTLDRLPEPFRDATGFGIVQRLPRICLALDEATSALDSGKNDLGNPITPGEVARSLRTLSELVRADLLQQSIHAPLAGGWKEGQSCIAQLDVIIGNIEKAPSTAGASLRKAADTVLPNDALRALRSVVEQLTVDHPRRQDAILDPKLDEQLPWICRTLEEAASALESGLDPFGNSITNTQICGGLRTLTEMVRDPEYLTAMEVGRAGIARPLERCMEQLEVIIGGIEVPATAGPSSSKGIDTLVALCTELGILHPDKHVEQAVEELREEGESGSRSLAVLVRELLACRSPNITYALHVAGQVVPVPELLDAVRAVAAASELTEAPAHGRFTPHIVGGGRVGWASGTYRQVLEAAENAAASLGAHRFVDNSDGTVTDTTTGLMWQRDAGGTKVDYESAEKYCDKLAVAGFTDWKLPNKEGLAGLATAGLDDLAAVFPDLERERYWAASPRAELGSAEAPERIAYTVDFDPASGNYCQAITFFRTYSYFVRAVRDIGNDAERATFTSPRPSSRTGRDQS